MMLEVLCCLLMMFGTGRTSTHGHGQDLDRSSSEQLLVELRTLVYRLTTDVASVLEDTKTLLAHVKPGAQTSPQAEHDEAEKKSQAAASLSCKGKEEGLTSLQFADDALPFTAPCDGQGWLVFLRRVDDGHQFYARGWDDYRGGFGNPRRSFWLGLETLHRLTHLPSNPAVLRVELVDWNDERRHAQYSFFRVESEQHAYRLLIDGYTGDAGNSLEYSNGMKFSTKDNDNDENSSKCASEDSKRGGWWYKSCFQAVLTSQYIPNGANVGKWKGLIWIGWKGESYSYKQVEMKLRLLE